MIKIENEQGKLSIDAVLSIEGSFEGWIRRIMVNECISFLRVNKKMKYTEDEFFVEESFDAIGDQFSVEEIQTLIDTLPDQK